MATFSGSVAQSALLLRKRRRRSAREQATRKYSWTKPQSLPPGSGIVGIQDPREGFGGEPLGHGADEIALAELLEIEVIGSRRRPQPEGVDGFAAVTDHRTVEGNADQRGGFAEDGVQGAAPHLERATQFHLDFFLRPGHLPGIGTTEPVVRLLPLPAVLDGLTEHAVFVPQPVTHRRQLHRRHRVEETGGQAPESPIAQTRVRFLVEKAEPVQVLLLDGLPDQRFQQEIRDIVGQRATDEEFQRKIVDALGVLALIGVFREHPALRENVPHGVSKGFKSFAWAGGRQFDDPVEDQVALVKRVVRPHELHRTTAILLADLRQTVNSC